MGVLDQLTGPERALIDAARVGHVLTCADDTEIRAELVRELLLGVRGELAPRGVRLRGARLTGGLDLAHATATTGLSLVDCDLTTPPDLESATVPWLVLDESRLAGPVCLDDAHVRGNLSLAGTEVRGDAGPALTADRLRVGGVLRLPGARVSGSGDDGAIGMHGAHVGGDVDLRRVELRNDSGPALNTTNLTVDGNVRVDDAEVSGRGDKGALRLSGARVGGLLVLDGVAVDNVSGPGVRADGVHVGGELNLCGARVSGATDLGALALRSGRVAYDVHIVDAVLHNDSGPALYAEGLHVDGALVLRRSGLSSAGEGVACVVRLDSARVGGQLSIVDSPVDSLAVNDFTYGSLDGVTWERWLALIRDHTREYRASPYQQLAAVERAAGHDGNARKILISQQHDLRRHAPQALGGWLTRRFHWLWGALAGYGYRARRTAGALLIALAVAGGVSLWAGHVQTGPGRHAAEHTAATPAPGTPCSTVELIGLGLDRGLPLGPTGLRSRCDLDTQTAAGQMFTVLLWLVQAAVWGLATLVIAGYTGLVRKTG